MDRDNKIAWSKKDIAEELAVSVRSVERMISNSKFPKPVILPETSIKRWRPIEVRRFLGL